MLKPAVIGKLKHKIFSFIENILVMRVVKLTIISVNIFNRFIDYYPFYRTHGGFYFFPLYLIGIINGNIHFSSRNTRNNIELYKNEHNITKTNICAKIMKKNKLKCT